MKGRTALLLGVILGCALSARASVGLWRNYTCMKEVRAAAHREGVFWAATSGGLFAWNPSDGSFRTWTNAEGLRNTDLTAVAVDEEGTVWTGTSGGMLHAYRPDEELWRSVTDIADSPRPRKGIKGLYAHRDTLLVCTDFGLSLFRVRPFEFGDTYTRFGNIPSSIRVSVSSCLIHDGNIWIALSAGTNRHHAAFASLGASNLLPPEAWTLEIVDTITAATRVLEVFRDRLFAGTERGLFVRTGGVWTGIAPFGGKPITGLAVSGDRLVVSTGDREVFTLDSALAALPRGGLLPSDPSCVAGNPAGLIVAGSRDMGLLRLDGAWRAELPNGPNSNQFISLAVDPSGTLWAASGSGGNGKGFYRFNGQDWKSFTAASSGLPTDDYFRVSIGCGGSVWASSFGRGAVEIPAGTDTVDTARIYYKNVGLVGIPNDTNYVVVSTVQCDDRGNTWMTVIKPDDFRTLIARTPEGTWVRNEAHYGSGRITSLLENIPVDRSFALDGSGNLWVVSWDAVYRGVLSLGSRGASNDSVDYHLYDGNGLPSNDVRTLVVDRDNDIWVGTDRGIGIILDPERPTRSGAVASYRPLAGRVVNTIAVDALNRKWVGTNEGAILLSQDGTQQLASYSVESTGGRLMDNDVKSIAVDDRTGIVYFGTAAGLASLTTPALTPRTGFDRLHIYPNPYLLPHPRGDSLTVDGLVANSGLKVLTVDGRVLRTLATPGGSRGFWDGRDSGGNLVPTGVYLIVAFSEDGKDTATGKVAVIRRQP
ncbi:MAG: two-component regulator propeller domain-containing protein [Bacteroidota bacterium]